MASPNTVQKVITEAAKAAGVKKLRAHQQKAVEEFVKGSDVFIALPTGYGKSIIKYGIIIALSVRQSQRENWVDDRSCISTY